MTFVRSWVLFPSNGRNGGHRSTEFDFPGHFRIGYCARNRLLLLITGRRLDDSTTDGTREAVVGPKRLQEEERMASLPTFVSSRRVAS